MGIISLPRDHISLRSLPLGSEHEVRCCSRSHVRGAPQRPSVQQCLWSYWTDSAHSRHCCMYVCACSDHGRVDDESSRRRMVVTEPALDDRRKRLWMVRGLKLVITIGFVGLVVWGGAAQSPLRRLLSLSVAAACMHLLNSDLPSPRCFAFYLPGRVTEDSQCCQVCG
jgi:hypothetical protein